MTKEESIDLSIIIWEKLAKDGRKGRKDINETKNFMNGCPLCEYTENIRQKTRCVYTRNITKDKCLFCPGYSKWKTKDNKLTSRCDDTGTIWTEWMSNHLLSSSHLYGIPKPIRFLYSFLFENDSIFIKGKETEAAKMVQFLKTLKDDNEN